MKRLSRSNTVPDHQRYKVLEPVMTIDPGETIIVETINHMTPVVTSEADLHAHGSPDYREREETGPIYVNGAIPGDMLAVRIDRIDFVGYPHAHGCGPLADQYHQQPILVPVENGICSMPGGISVPATPMIGDIYTTPLKPVSYDHGGNMDFTEVRPGNTLYLPVFHKGGLLVLGDVHALQGDAEIYAEGAETAADVTVTISVDSRFRHPRPLVETPDMLYTVACRGALFDSIQLATADMVDLLAGMYGMSKNDAYILACMRGNLRLAGCLCSRAAAEKHCIVALGIPKNLQRKGAKKKN